MQLQHLLPRNLLPQVLDVSTVCCELLLAFIHEILTRSRYSFRSV